MSVRDDAIFLAGFITGTYDLKGESLPPVRVQKVIDRIMIPETEPSKSVPRLFPIKTDHALPDGVVEFRDGDKTVLRIEKTADPNPEKAFEQNDPSKTEYCPAEKKDRKKIELTPEESERRSQRMKDMWMRKKAEKEIKSSIPAVTSMVVRSERPEKQGNVSAPSMDGA